MRVTFDLSTLEDELFMGERPLWSTTAATDEPGHFELLELWDGLWIFERKRREAGARLEWPSFDVPIEAASDDALRAFLGALLFEAKAHGERGVFMASALAHVVGAHVQRELWQRANPLRLDS